MKHEEKQQQKIIFVTGKGGVGKSIFALALAQKYSQGQKVLLVELGLHSFYSDFLGVSVEYRPTPLSKNLDIALWSGAECLKEYALHLLKAESLYKLFFENRISRALIDVAPALSELAILGKATSGIRQVGPELSYDVIIVDAYATGHFMALLRAPRGMNESIQFGPMAEQTRTILKTIRDPQICEYAIVTLPEELPAVEAEELHQALVSEVGLNARIYCNKVWPQAEILKLKKESGTAGVRVSDAEMNFVQELESLVERQQVWIQYLKQRDSNMKLIPMVFSSEPRQIVTEVGKSLL